MIADTDIDIDVADRDSLLKHIRHTRAYGKKDGVHKVGIYIQDIPYNPILDAAVIEFKDAGDLGFFKFDILNNSIYEGIENEDQLVKLMEEPLWTWFQDKEIVKQLAHIHDYSDMVASMKPQSVKQLAMVLALIRPAKNFLIGRTWEEIERDIWTKPSDGGYYFKKAHAIAFSMSIIVQVNLIHTNDTP